MRRPDPDAPRAARGLDAHLPAGARLLRADAASRTWSSRSSSRGGRCCGRRVGRAERARARRAARGVRARRASRDDRAGELSFGQRKLLEFAAVLMGEPRLVLLDEPTAGVNPVMVETMERHIRELHAAGLTFLDRRARHAPRHAPVRPGDRARPRRQDRRGHAARRAAATRASSTPTWGSHDARCSIRGLVAGYGQGDILRGVDLDVESGTITCVIGPNGAGKSTVLEGDQRPAARRARDDRARRRRRSTGLSPRGVLEARHRPRAAGAQPLPADDRVGQRADGRPRPRATSGSCAAAREELAERFPLVARAPPRRARARCRAASRRSSRSPAR